MMSLHPLTIWAKHFHFKTTHSIYFLLNLFRNLSKCYVSYRGIHRERGSGPIRLRQGRMYTFIARHTLADTFVNVHNCTLSILCLFYLTLKYRYSVTQQQHQNCLLLTIELQKYTVARLLEGSLLLCSII